MRIRSLFAAGHNVLQELYGLSTKSEVDSNDIGIAYDLQAGEYVTAAMSMKDRWKQYGVAIGEVLRPHLEEGDSLLDCGTGELTSLTATQMHLLHKGPILAMDISWSRLVFGREFWRSSLGSDEYLKLFVADISRIPMPSKSIDVVITVHALEPNFGHERELLSELLRVCRKRLILLEPSYENADRAGRERMEKHNYVRDLPSHLEQCGGRLISYEAFKNPMNPLNPTWTHIVQPGQSEAPLEAAAQYFECPITGTPLVDIDDFLWSRKSGLAYPIMKGIPLLRPEHAILASALSHFE